MRPRARTRRRHRLLLSRLALVGAAGLIWLGTHATGTSPYGPWTNRGVVLQKRLAAGIKGTGHHSVVKAPGTDTW